MNETILTPREKYLLNLISQTESQSREAILSGIANLYPISKPTLIRDLNKLLTLGLIRTSGQARAVRYLPVDTNPLLRYFDLPEYFRLEQDLRKGVKTSFDFTIFDNLTQLFTSSEIEIINSQNRLFSQATSRLDPTIVKRELERFVIELSWKSSKIEGNTYSLLETETLIKEGRETSGKTSHEAIMILNHKQAFETILANRTDFQKLTVSTVMQLHTILTTGLNITPGIRSFAVGVTGTAYRPPDNRWQIEEALAKTIQAINSASFPLAKAIIVIAMISYLQPFVDGNKRTGRMLGNALLLASDYFPLSYRSVDENEYKESLILFYEQGSLYHLKRLIVTQYQFATKTYFS